MEPYGPEPLAQRKIFFEDFARVTFDARFDELKIRARTGSKTGSTSQIYAFELLNFFFEHRFRCLTKILKIMKPEVPP